MLTDFFLRALIVILMLVLGINTLDAQILVKEPPVEYFKVKRQLIGYKKYHDNGQMAESGYYKFGRPHGVWTCFDKDGKVVTQARYERGVKHGLWYFWDSQGKILCEIRYDYGVVLSAKQFDVRGTVIAAIGY